MIFNYLLALFQILVLASARAQADEYASDPNIFELTPSNFDKVVHKSNYTTLVKFTPLGVDTVRNYNQYTINWANTSIKMQSIPSILLV